MNDDDQADDVFARVSMMMNVLYNVGLKHCLSDAAAGRCLCVLLTFTTIE